MSKIQISEAMLLWTPLGTGRATDGKAMVVKHPDIAGIGDDMTDAFGACSSDWLSKSDDAKFAAMAIEATMISIRGEIKDDVLHDALMGIDWI